MTPNVASLGPHTLTGRFVALEPVAEQHHEELARAGADPNLFRHIPAAGNASNFPRWLQHFAADIASGKRLAYAVRRLSDNALVGSTSYLDILPRDARVEIGATWYTEAAQGTAVNPEAKLLLLKNAFEAGYNCVFLKTDSKNARSRAAIGKLGAKFDGILRGHMWMDDQQYFRDTAFFSILRDEWPAVREGLENRLAAFSK
ncbi:MAG TPA: GNAT family protein [Rhizomicrobium sp.]|jgi:RimJ/RimL family protein N-acetyltransferase|nr:GNAT family protein [Rhizomicrobium sp.]